MSLDPNPIKHLKKVLTHLHTPETDGATPGVIQSLFISYYFHQV